MTRPVLTTSVRILARNSRTAVAKTQNVVFSYTDLFALAEMVIQEMLKVSALKVCVFNSYKP